MALFGATQGRGELSSKEVQKIFLYRKMQIKTAFFLIVLTLTQFLKVVLISIIAI